MKTVQNPHDHQREASSSVRLMDLGLEQQPGLPYAIDQGR
jgi:hypothetical protein